MTNKKMILLSGVAVAALAFAAVPVLTGSALHFVGKAHAAEDGSGGGKGKGAQGQNAGNQGAGGQQGGAHGAGGAHGSSSDHGDSGDSADEGEGHQGGPSEESDAKGPKYMGGDNEHKPTAGEQGGKPVWAQEGIPEIELGRLNVARSPAHVIDKAASEALANFDADASASLYSMSAEDFASYVAAHYDEVTRIDSPLENLGLLKSLMSSGSTQLSGVTPASQLDLAAIFLGSASDKTIAISNDTVSAVNTILGLPELTPDQVSTLATKAEAVRAAILEGHGE